MKCPRAEAEISIDFPTESDAEAISRALIPETAGPRGRRAYVRVARRGRVTKMKFYAGDLVALRAMVNSFLRFAATWRRVSENLNISTRRRGRIRRIGEA